MEFGGRNKAMKLLFITQKVDKGDSNLGFFHYWLEKFSSKLDQSYVVCLNKGESQLPSNMEVFSLGKESGFGKIRQFFRLQKFLFKHLKQVDGVFCHMCPIYAIFSWPLVTIYNKKMVLWYLHKSVTFKLKLVQKLVDSILTASEKSCRLKNRKKIKIVGHGIDINIFKPLNISEVGDSTFNILSAGRVAPVKNLDILIQAVEVLVNQKNIKNLKVSIVGAPVDKIEQEYAKRIKSLVKEKGLDQYIQFVGAVDYSQMPDYYQQANLFINLSQTGSIDKAVLEAMASGSLVLTSNEAFNEILSKEYLFNQTNTDDLANKIVALINKPKDDTLREMVIKDHSLDNLTSKIIKCFQD